MLTIAIRRPLLPFASLLHGLNGTSWLQSVHLRPARVVAGDWGHSFGQEGAESVQDILNECAIITTIKLSPVM